MLYLREARYHDILKTATMSIKDGQSAIAFLQQGTKLVVLWNIGLRGIIWNLRARADEFNAHVGDWSFFFRRDMVVLLL